MSLKLDCLDGREAVPYASYAEETSIATLPLEIMRAIFSHLNWVDLPTCTLVNRQWKQLAKDLLEEIEEKIAFGKRKWMRYFGDIGEEAPPLPLKIYSALQEPCCFYPDRRVWQTHMLVLIPSTIDQKPFNANLLIQLTNPYFPNNEAGSHYASSGPTEAKEPIPKAYWVLMSKAIAEKIMENNHREQRVNSKIKYEEPQLLEAMTCIFATHISSQENPSADNLKIDVCTLNCYFNCKLSHIAALWRL